MRTLKTIKEDIQKSIQELQKNREFYSKLIENEIIDRADFLDWKYISEYTSLEVIAKLVKNFSDDINWNIICKRDLTKEFIDEFYKEIIKTLYIKYR